MLYGLQTHFGECIGQERCEQLYKEGIQLCRIDAMECDIQTMHDMVAEVVAAGMQPFPIVHSYEKLWALEGVEHCEWGNEPKENDPADYRRELNEACRIAQEKGIKLWAPAIANLSEASFRFANAVRDAGDGWPEGLYGVSVHRYGPGGPVETPHAGFESRDNEVSRWLYGLREKFEGSTEHLPFLVSEFGHDTAVRSEEEAAARIAWEWAFWQKHGATAAVLYQLNDGPVKDANSDYGLYRVDGSIKEAIAATIPKPPVEEPDPEPEPEPEPEPVYPFWPEEGKLYVSNDRFFSEVSGLFQWRGYSWFLGFLRYCRGEDVTPDLRWMRSMGFNIPRIFGPLPWTQTPDYRIENFDFDKLDGFLTLLEKHGLRSNWSLGHYRHPGLNQFAQRFYDIASQHWSVVVELVNEPSVGDSKPDPIQDFASLYRYGIPTAYGYNAKFYSGGGEDPVLDFATLHVSRDSAWHRKARHAQEWQNKIGKPVISDEPAKITEPGFDYPGGKNDPSKTPAEMVWHAAVCCLWTAGCTVHTEEGKWGRVPSPGMLQHTVCEAVLENVWRHLEKSWQMGEYNHSGNNDSPVDDANNPDGSPIWTYTSLHPNNHAISVRCAMSAPQAINGWRVVNRWGPAGSLVRLERP